MKQYYKRYLNIEKEFFELDPEQKTALVRMKYEKPSDIIDPGAVTKVPRLTSDFLEDLIGKFDHLPSRYKMHFLITFLDMEGYSEEQMADICNDNLMLETKTRNRIAHNHNRLALYLCVTGLICILLAAWIGNIWKEESMLRNIIAYILDIVATVPFWAAMEIYFIDNSERRRTLINLSRRIDGIEFRHEEAE